MEKLPVIAIVVPCYNEQEVLPITVPAMLSVLDRLASKGLASDKSYVMLCDDGSRDNTWTLIEQYHIAKPTRIKGLSLAHNRGHQNVLLAGLMAVRQHCDAAISIDADLQDDPDAMIEMADKFLNQNKDIVYGVRTSRRTDTWFKRTSAHAFYSFQKKMGLDTVFDHADYRLMSQRALDLLSEFGESNLFLRGIIPQIGLQTDTVGYERASRIAGESKYPLGKMLSFSIDGITSFSAKPMRIIFLIGLIFLLIDLIVAIYVAISVWFSDHISPGWTSLILSVWFLGSLILMGIGIVGEYIGKIFIEVKQRPRYQIKDILFD